MFVLHFRPLIRLTFKAYRLSLAQFHRSKNEQARLYHPSSPGAAREAVWAARKLDGNVYNIQSSNNQLSAGQCLVIVGGFPPCPADPSREDHERLRTEEAWRTRHGEYSFFQLKRRNSLFPPYCACEELHSIIAMLLSVAPMPSRCCKLRLAVLGNIANTSCPLSRWL